MAAFPAYLPECHSDIIRLLLAAERRGKELIEKARRRRAQTLKRAVEEANLELELLKQQLELQYQARIDKVSESHDRVSALINERVAAEMRLLEEKVNKRKERAIIRLIEEICHTPAVLHKNYQTIYQPKTKPQECNWSPAK